MHRLSFATLALVLAPQAALAQSYLALEDITSTATVYIDVESFTMELDEDLADLLNISDISIDGGPVPATVDGDGDLTITNPGVSAGGTVTTTVFDPPRDIDYEFGLYEDITGNVDPFHGFLDLYFPMSYEFVVHGSGTNTYTCTAETDTIHLSEIVNYSADDGSAVVGGGFELANVDCVADQSGFGEGAKALGYQLVLNSAIALYRDASATVDINAFYPILVAGAWCDGSHPSGTHYNKYEGSPNPQSCSCFDGTETCTPIL